MNLFSGILGIRPKPYLQFHINFLVFHHVGEKYYFPAHAGTAAETNLLAKNIKGYLFAIFIDRFCQGKTYRGIKRTPTARMLAFRLH